MDGFKKGLQSLATESSKTHFPSASTSTSVSLDQSGVLVRRTHGHTVTLSTCTKLCSVAFVAGIIVGYTLKRRVRRWAERFLKRLKD